MSYSRFGIIVIGSSAGGIEALSAIAEGLTHPFPVPIAAVQHLSADSDTSFIDVLSGNLDLRVTEAQDKMKAEPNVMYVAPPDYHLLVDSEGIFSLSVEEKVNYSRPSIDVLFKSAALAYGRMAIGVVLTGANNDGAEGLKAIRAHGGTAVVQNPDTAYCSTMPGEAIETAGADYITELNNLAEVLIKLAGAAYAE